MDNVIDVLRDKGHKITPQRRAVINALLNCGPFSTALQLLEYVKKEQPDVSLDTVYRNLSLFQQLGIVNEIQIRVNSDENFFLQKLPFLMNNISENIIVKKEVDELEISTLEIIEEHISPIISTFFNEEREKAEEILYSNC